MVTIGDTEMADKRIRELQAQILPLLSDFIATDRVGALEATRMTVQQLVDLVSTSVSKQDANAGTTTPDNAFGTNGDFYFQIPTDGSFLRMFKKEAGSWSTVFNIPLPYSISFSNPDDASGNIAYVLPTGKTITGVDIAQVIGGTPIRSNAFPTYNDGVIYGGFTLLDLPDTQTITIKIA